MRANLADARLPGLREGSEPVPGFRLIRRRGRGGFGEVWEAEAPGGIRVALKFVHGLPRAQDAELRALNCLRDIHHPNLLANFGAWQVDGALVVGMELADGSLWDRYIEAANAGLAGIPRAELLGLMGDAASGVDYLNEPRHAVDGRAGVGIQHRDIKPPNLLLFGGGVKVADLGMARAMVGVDDAHSGTWTFPYAAPEFFRGRVSRRSDQYGLAATYCQLRSGRLPFEGHAATVAAGHLYGRPDLDGLPEAERPIIARALAKEPADRWPDCRSFVDAIRALGPDLAPETLPGADDPSEIVDIPRRFRSSTGSSGLRSDDAPAPSWHPFDSTGSLDSFMQTDEAHPPGTPGSAPTAIVRRDRPRRRRVARHAASTLAVGLAIAAAGVRSTSDTNPVPAPRGRPAPSKEVAPAPASAPTPTPAAVEVPMVPAASASAAPDAPEVARADAPPPAATPRSDPPNPSASASASEARGRAFLARDAFEPAIAEFDRAIRLRPGLASSYLHRALARHRASQYPEALADYSEAIRLRPGDPFAWTARGQAHHDTGAYDRAVADYSEAIRLRPDDPSTLHRRGLAFYRSDRYARALADFDEAIRLDPKDIRAREFRADSLARLGGRAGPDRVGPTPGSPASPPPTAAASATTASPPAAITPTVRIQVRRKGLWPAFKGPAQDQASAGRLRAWPKAR